MRHPHAWIGVLCLGTVWWTVGVASAAPAIVHQPPLEGKKGKPIPITATVTDPRSPVTQVRLYYRSAGTLSYRIEIMTGAGYGYSAVIPASEITGTEVEYYLEARNQNGEATTSPMFNPAGAPHRILLREDGAAPVSFRLLSPEPGAILPAEQVVIVIAIDAPGGRTGLARASLWLDERDVTAQAQVTETLISYAPPAPLSPGVHGVRLESRTEDGQTAVSPTWSFTVSGPAGAVSTAEPEGRAGGLQFSGRVSAESQVAALTREPGTAMYLSQPRGWLNRLQVQFDGRSDDWNVLGSIYLTSEEQPGRQPVDRVRLELFNPSLRFVLGDFYPLFSEYSFSNLFLRGGSLTLHTGVSGESQSEFQVLGGLTRYAVNGRSDAPGTFEQWAMGTRWLYDFLPGTGVALNYGTINDYSQSIEESGGAQPSNNHMATAEAHIQARWSDALSTRLYGEYGYSYYDETQIITSIALGDAYRGGMRWEWTGGNAVQVEYRHTGSQFVSLGNPWLVSDWGGLSGDLHLNLVQQDLAFSAQVDSWQDNLDGQKSQAVTDFTGTTVTAGTTQSLNASALLVARPWPFLPNLSLGVSFFQQADDGTPYRLTDNQTLVVHAGAGVTAPLGPGQVLGTLSVSNSDYQDRTEFKRTGNVQSSSYLASAQYLLGQDWSFAAGGGLTRTRTDNRGVDGLSGGVPLEQQIDYWLANAQVRWKLLPNRLDVQTGWETVSGQDDLTHVEDNLTTLSLGGTYYFSSTQSASLTLSHIGYADRIQTDRSYGEFVVNARYGLMF